MSRSGGALAVRPERVVVIPPRRVFARSHRTFYFLLAILSPVSLVAWARATAELVRISPVALPVLGWAIATLGLLPLVVRIPRFVPHPACTALCAICVGASIAVGSASGLWLVSPGVILGCVAFVFGTGRVGSSSVTLLPQAGALPPTGMDRLRCFLYVIIPWLILYEAVLAVGIPHDAISGVTRFEQGLPVLEWTQIFYGSTYFFVLAVPFLAGTRSDLRWFSVRALWTMLFVYPAFLVIPLVAPKRPFVAHTLPGQLLLWERSLDSSVAAFPSFHVIWAIVAAQVFARRWPERRWFLYGWAVLITVSCVTTSQHSVLDVLGGITAVWLTERGPRIWRALRRWAEHLEWRGVYAGIGAFAAVGLAGSMAGGLSRASGWLAAAAVAAGAPWGQAMWRLQCIARGRGYGWLAPENRGTAPLPLPLYSMVMDLATGIVVMRLWMVGSPLHLVAGVYCVLAGLGWFAVSGSRGENSLWGAAACSICGVLITALGRSGAAPFPRITVDVVWQAVAVGLFVVLVDGLRRTKAHSTIG